LGQKTVLFMATQTDFICQPCIPHLTIPNQACEEALAYYADIFEGEVKEEKRAKDKKRIMHSQLRLSNGGVIFLCDEFPEFAKSKTYQPKKGESSSMSMNLSYRDPEIARKIWNKITASKSADISVEFAKQDWGQYYGRFQDKFGNTWSVAAPLTAIKDQTTSNGRKRKLNEVEEHKNDEDDANSDTHKKRKVMLPQEGFVRVEDKGAMIVLTRPCVVGNYAGCTHHCFGDAAKQAFGELLAYLTNHETLSKKYAPTPLALSPDDPDKIKQARFKPGFIINDCSSAEEVKLGEEESGKFEVVSIPAHKWYIYQHVGSYAGLHAAYTAALKSLEEQKYKNVDDLVFESYVDNPGEVKEDQLRTWIYFAVKQ